MIHFSKYLVYVFGISEVLLLILKRSKHAGAKSKKDGNSLQLLWIVITGCLVAGNVIAGVYILIPIEGSAFIIIGMALTIVGFIIRWIAIVQLGSMFTVDVAISSQHVLKTNGLYKLVRHPSYLGLMLIIAGIAFLTNNVLSCAVIIVPVFLALNYRISVEEKALTDEFGEQYLEYKRKVKRIVPLIY